MWIAIWNKKAKTIYMWLRKIIEVRVGNKMIYKDISSD